MRQFEQVAASLETSEAIIQAISEAVGEDERRILAEWQQPACPQDIINRARALAPGEPLYWGGAGCVYQP